MSNPELSSVNIKALLGRYNISHDMTKFMNFDKNNIAPIDFKEL